MRAENRGFQAEFQAINYQNLESSRKQISNKFLKQNVLSEILNV